MKLPTTVDVLDHTWDILKEICTTKTALSAVTLATVDRDDQPQVCLVVLRAVDRDHRILEFHTDADSLKCQSLARNPKAQILIWHEINAVQLRLSVEVSLWQGKRAAELWKKVPSPSQIAYGKQPPTGTVINGPLEYKTLSAEEKFLVAECQTTKIDYLSLKEDHFRVQFEKKNGWSGNWISP